MIAIKRTQINRTNRLSGTTKRKWRERLTKRRQTIKLPTAVTLGGAYDEHSYGERKPPAGAGAELWFK